MANTQTLNTNKTASSATVCRKNQPGLKKVNRENKTRRATTTTTVSSASASRSAASQPAKQQRRMYVDHKKQAVVAVGYPKVATLTQDLPAFHMLEEVLLAFGNAKATGDKRKFEVTRELALVALAKRDPEACANEDATAKGTQIAKEALNWAHNKLTQPVASN